MRAGLLHVVALAGLALTVSCTGTVQEPPVLCIPGASLACTCPDGRPGAQQCASSGLSVGSCVCTSKGDGQVAGDAGAGAGCGNLTLCAPDGGPEVCADTERDPAHCGACGTRCEADEVCAEGECRPSCGELTRCVLDGGTSYCANLQSDNDSCGACGVACPSGTACSGGTCGTSCGAPLNLCSGACVDTQSDREHCGACGNVCAPGEGCDNGTCGPSCGTLVVCGIAGIGRYCADTKTDPLNCGGCGTACAAGSTCVQGSCEATCGGLVRCTPSGAAPYCANTQTDNANCGTCGNACTAGTLCTGGVCASNCGALATCQVAGAPRCVNTQTDNAHCGTCGNTCPAGTSCSGGTCQTTCGALATCTGTGGAKYCADTKTDSLNCGGCGTACAAGLGCNQGVCECPAGHVRCGSACVSLTTNPAHCGACNVACAPGLACLSGSCGCTQGLTACAGTCVDTTRDERHCGACGVACPSTQTCEAGVCKLVLPPGTLGGTLNPALPASATAQAQQPGTGPRLTTKAPSQAALAMAGGVPTRAAASPAFTPGLLRVKLAGAVEGGAAVLRALRPSGVRLEYVRYQFGAWHVVRATSAAGEPLTGAALDEALGRVRALKQVPHADKDPILQPLAVPNDPYFGGFQRWHYEQARLPGAWDTTTGSNSVVVAVLDDGITPHPDFGTRRVAGYDFVSDPTAAGDGDGRDSDPTRPAIFSDGRVSFHGTHVAGTIGAASNNSVGAAGVDWNARILPVRVLGLAGGSMADIIDGLRWAGGLSVPGIAANPHPARVLNLSLGGLGPPDTEFQDVVDELNLQKRIVVIAAGNSDLDASQFQPANQQGVITVGAVGLDGNRASYSNFGSAVDLMAPGGDFEDLDRDGRQDTVFSLFATATGSPEYDGSNGTSMAAPHVAGIVALMAAVNPLLDHSMAESLLKSSASPQFRCIEGCGAGLVNAELAVQMASGVASYIGPRLMVSPGAMALGAAATATLEVHNIGAQDLHFTLLTRGAFAHRVGLAAGMTGTVTPGQKQVLTLNVDRSSLANGTYPLTLRFESDGGTQEVPVSFRVGPRPEPAIQVVALRRDASGALVPEASVSVASASAWNWSLSVKPGTYYLVAGSDEDNDGVMGEPGEHFGAWPVESDPQEVVVYAQQALRGLHFATAPRLVVPTPGTGQFGAACTANADCASLLCLGDGNGGGTCTRDCVPGTASCPSAYYCAYAYNTYTGVGIDVCQAQLANGFTCEKAEECLSGTCFEGSFAKSCEKPCQSAMECASTETCAAEYDKTLAIARLCLPPREVGSLCIESDQCVRPSDSGGCVLEVPNGVCSKPCTAGCGSTATCAALDVDGDAVQESALCLATCTTTQECRTGFTCVQQASGAKACVPQRGQACTTSYDCWGDEFCDKAAGFCRSAYGTSFTITDLSPIFSSATADGFGDPPDAYAWVSNALVSVSTNVQQNTYTPTWPLAFTVSVPRGETLEFNFTDVDAVSDDFIGKVQVNWLEAVRTGSYFDSLSSGNVTSIYFKVTPVP